MIFRRIMRRRKKSRRVVRSRFRRRWAPSIVALEDQGDIAAAEGALAEELDGLDLAGLRRHAREDERVAEERGDS